MASYRFVVLRKYQQEAVERLYEHPGPSLAIMATGLGKSHVIAGLAAKYAPRPVLVLTDRSVIFEQLVARMRQHDFLVLVEKADLRTNSYQLQGARRLGHPVVVASTASLRGSRLAKFQHDDFAAVIYDEAHHATARTWRSIYEHFSAAKHHGVTATPQRRGLGELFADVYNLSIAEAVKAGWLVPFELYAVRVGEWDLRALRKSKGDITGASLDASINSNLPAILRQVLEHAQGKTLIFWPSVRASREAASWLRSQGRDAIHIDGKTSLDTRAHDLYRPNVEFFCNCGVLTEGFDMPALMSVVLCRPTMSEILYAQMIGRGARPFGATLEDTTAAARHTAIATSPKPKVRIVDLQGIGNPFSLAQPFALLPGDASTDIPSETTARAKKAPSEITALIQARALELWHQGEELYAAERLAREEILGDIDQQYRQRERQREQRAASYRRRRIADAQLQPVDARNPLTGESLSARDGECLTTKVEKTLRDLGYRVSPYSPAKWRGTRLYASRDGAGCGYVYVGRHADWSSFTDPIPEELDV